MPTTFETLSVQDAKRMLGAGEAKASQIGVPYTIAVASLILIRWKKRSRWDERVAENFDYTQ